MVTELYPIEWLDQILIDGRAQFWRSPKAAAVTEIKVYPSGVKDIHCLVAAGSREEIEHILIPAAIEWAKRQGCTGALVESREGWVRALRKYGFEPFQSAARKEI